MTVAELIQQLQALPAELPVYFRDTDGDWLPCQSTDVQPQHFYEMGRYLIRPGTKWFITVGD